MKHLMSINKKFMEIKPQELIDITSGADGFEIFINYENKDEVNYLKELATKCKVNNKLLQVHGDSSMSYYKQLQYINLLQTIADTLGYKIHIVLHPIYNKDVATSIKLTIDYFDKLIKNINLDKITLSVENLDKSNDNNNLNKSEIKSIILSNKNIYFTYDIGHELIDNKDFLNIDDTLVKLITNVHLHTYNDVYSYGYDHKPIYKGDKHWNKLVKAITFLKDNYDGKIVYEYDVYACKGNSLQQKIVDYTKSIIFMKSNLDKN